MKKGESFHMLGVLLLVSLFVSILVIYYFTLVNRQGETTTSTTSTTTKKTTTSSTTTSSTSSTLRPTTTSTTIRPATTSTTTTLLISSTTTSTTLLISSTTTSTTFSTTTTTTIPSGNGNCLCVNFVCSLECSGSKRGSSCTLLSHCQSATTTSSTTSTTLNQNPKGYFDSADSSYLRGWACDPSSYSTPIYVHFYKDGPAGTGTYINSTLASSNREQTVCDLCGGTCNHGFVYPTPSSLNDGAQHTIYAYAINIPEGDNPQLINSPRTLNAGSTTTTTSTSSTTTTTLPAGCDAGDRMEFTPSSPKVSQEVTIDVSSINAYAWVVISINGENRGGPSPPYQSGGRWYWEWKYTPATTGAYNVKFYMNAVGNVISPSSVNCVSGSFTAT